MRNKAVAALKGVSRHRHVLVYHPLWFVLLLVELIILPAGFVCLRTQSIDMQHKYWWELHLYEFPILRCAYVDTWMQALFSQIYTSCMMACILKYAFVCVGGRANPWDSFLTHQRFITYQNRGEFPCTQNLAGNHSNCCVVALSHLTLGGVCLGRAEQK